MIRRLSFVLSTIGSLALTGLAAAQQPAAPPAPGAEAPAAGTGRQQPEGPRPYRQVITAQASNDSGVFLVHRISDKVFYEIPRRMFGREFLLVADQRGTIRGLRYAGEEISD